MAHFKSPVRPLCRSCGKPIKKRTFDVYFGRNPSTMGRLDAELGCTYKAEKPTSKAEAQRLVNMQIVSLNWMRPHSDGVLQPDLDYIWKATVWDGETYVDEFFDSNNCAIDLGRAAARAGKVLKPHNDAVEARNARSQS